MKIIAITSPEVIEADEYIIKVLIKQGIDIVHLRKPDSSIDECRNLLAKLTDKERGKIVVHDYPELYYEFSLMGIHINKNITSLPEGYSGINAKLYPGYFLTKGQRGENVRDLQTYLNYIGEIIPELPTLPVTSYFGDQTEAAVKTFQQLYGLDISGAVGPVTWATIAKEYDYLINSQNG